MILSSIFTLQTTTASRVTWNLTLLYLEVTLYILSTKDEWHTPALQISLGHRVLYLREGERKGGQLA